MPLKCPHCGKLIEFEREILRQKRLTVKQLAWYLSLSDLHFNEKITTLLTRIVNLSDHPSTIVTRFINRLDKLHCTEDEIYHGLSVFFGKQYDKQGYNWAYALRVIETVKHQRELQKKQLTPIPKEIL